MRTALLLAIVALSLGACGRGSNGAGTGTPTSTPTATATPTATPPLAPVYKEVRGALHVHSPYSHDACDGQGLDNGIPNPACLADLRADACASGFDFVALTDHPANMEAYPFTADLLADTAAGDELVMDGGEPIANRIACPNGRRVILTVGYESTHTMPLGLRHHLPAGDLYSGLTDDIPLATANSLVQGLKAGGAVVAIAHSEEEDLSAARIVETGIDAMEWYNPHANFKSLASAENLSTNPLEALNTIRDMEKFLLGSGSGAHADLVYLLLLPSMPDEGFAKWREVQRSRPVTGLLGSDVHQNVSIDPLCAGSPALEAICGAAAVLYPNALTLLLSGGQIVLSDSDRIDSYGRVFRWVENRVLVTEVSPLAINEALRAGRSYGVFGVFGDPKGFDFHAADVSGNWPIGSVRPAPATIEVSLPTPVAKEGGAPFTDVDAADALVTIKLFRTDATGTVLMAESTNAALSHAAGPGTWHVEVWIRPLHLRTALGTEDELADRDFLWLIANPIRLN